MARCSRSFSAICSMTGAAAGRPEHAELALVNAYCTVFSGVVYAENTVDQLLFGQVARQTAGAWRLCHATGFRRRKKRPIRQPTLNSADASML